MFSTSSKRQSGGSRRFPLEDLRAALRDGRAWVELGVVYWPVGQAQHWELDGDDVLVHVLLMPGQEPLMCRLFHQEGIWRVPPVNTEVMVAFA